MRLEADRDRCVGAGMCALTAPDTFEQDDEDGMVLLLRHHSTPETAEAVRRAVDLCPSGALSLHE